jgi:hypothetical protein
MTGGFQVWRSADWTTAMGAKLSIITALANARFGGASLEKPAR